MPRSGIEPEYARESGRAVGSCISAEVVPTSTRPDKCKIGRKRAVLPLHHRGLQLKQSKSHIYV